MQKKEYRDELRRLHAELVAMQEYVKSAGAPDQARMRAAIERCAKSADYEEGRRAFMEKRKPKFTGR